MFEYMEDAETVSKELADIYAKASRHLNYEIEEIYNKFKTKHNLTDAEAKRLLNTLRNKTDIEELKKALAQDPKNADLLAEIESGAYRARIERLEQLQAEVDHMMQEVFEQEKKVTTSHYVDLATNSYYREIYNVQKRVGFQFSFSAVDPKTVALLLESKWSGANYSQRIWKNTKGVAADLKEQMLIGLLTGKGEEEMAREIANKYAAGAFEARRLVRTESNFISGQMQLAAYKECKSEEYDFVATLDLKTSKICRELDGKTFKIEDAKPGVNMNPMHPFCRSTTMIHMDEELKKKLKRDAWDPEKEEWKKVPATMNYNEWYKKNIANNPKALAAEKKIKNHSSDKKQYERYRSVMGKKAGKSFEDFQEIKYNNPEKWEEIKKQYKETKTNEKEK
ncbi:SPP1 gp7 family phage head morphogenesis protein [Lachnospiraceae bacterium 10-1]|nr:SPP1 gp7 family phage head morphogenesis protein [Lachnospiraceae bacterium 10-1]